jgi:hypothetical protein
MLTSRRAARCSTAPANAGTVGALLSSEGIGSSVGRYGGRHPVHALVGELQSGWFGFGAEWPVQGLSEAEGLVMAWLALITC